MNNDITILQTMARAYNEHDADGVAACFTEDGVYEAPTGPGPSGTSYVGREVIRAATAARFISSPDVHWEIESEFRVDDRGASSWTVTWTNPDGSFVELRGCDLFTLQGELILRKDSFFKTMISQS